MSSEAYLGFSAKIYHEAFLQKFVCERVLNMALISKYHHFDEMFR